MAATESKSTGGCMCGAVRYEVTGAPLSVSYCHCSSCRSHTGAPLVALVDFKPDQVRFTGGERAIYRSSPGVERAFCAQCGTPLTWEGVSGELGPTIDFHIGTFDEPDQFSPELHNHYGERIKWFDTADRLPRFHANPEGNEPCSYGPAASLASGAKEAEAGIQPGGSKQKSAATE